MHTATKLTGFALGLAVIFGVAYGAGQVAGPVAPATEVGHSATGSQTAGDDRPGHGHDDPPASQDGGSGREDGGDATGQAPGGLLVTDRGYTLRPVDVAGGQFAFQITGPDGRPVTGYDVVHDRPMHLIVARRDLSGFRHVHPELGADGTWRIGTPFAGPGVWRAFADFKPVGGEALTLGVDVTVPGPLALRPLPAPASSVTVNGYTVTIDGTLTPGRTAALTLTVSRGGVPVTDLEPYLGAYGHLVVLRHGDLAYLHVHPDGTPGDDRTRPGPAVAFHAEVPSAGTYRLYLDFQHAGAVHTAEFTMLAGAEPAGHGHD